MNRIELNLEQKLAEPESAGVLESLLAVKTGVKEFGKIKRNEAMGRIYMNGAKEVWSKVNKPDSTVEDEIVVKILAGKLIREREEEKEVLSLKEIINAAEEYGLEATKPETVFFVALRMLEDKSFSDEIFVLSKIEDNYRVFVVERDNDGDVSVDLYDDYLVNKGSEFDREEKFLLALSNQWDNVDIVF